MMNSNASELGSCHPQGLVVGLYNPLMVRLGIRPFTGHTISPVVSRTMSISF